MKTQNKRMSGRETAATVFAFYGAIVMLFILWLEKSEFRGGGYINQCDMDVRIVMTLIAIIFGSMSVYKFIKYRN